VAGVEGRQQPFGVEGGGEGELDRGGGLLHADDMAEPFPRDPGPR
jgi:hypothetical protein